MKDDMAELERAGRAFVAVLRGEGWSDFQALVAIALAANEIFKDIEDPALHREAADLFMPLATDDQTLAKALGVL